MGKFYEKASRIVIVDDDIDLLMLMERQLQKHHYNIETAASLPEAEEIINNFQPHLVILDVNVKGEDGRQLCWKLKNGTPYDIKVIIMSGYDVNMNRASLFGADEVIAKPAQFEYLLSRIEYHLEKKDTSSFPSNTFQKKDGS